MRNHILCLLLAFILLLGLCPAASAAAAADGPPAAWYEIFVRSFCDSDGDGLGDLNGVAQKLDYISSAGLRVLLTAQKTMNRQGSMKIVHVCETIMEIFEVTGFLDILTIE